MEVNEVPDELAEPTSFDLWREGREEQRMMEEFGEC